MPKHISKKQKDEIVDFYLSKPITIKEVADKFNICEPSVEKILNQYRIKRYSKVKLFSPNLDEHYFDNIDTEEKAYFLGLIITDGCIHCTKGKQKLVSITLQSSDAYILDDFKEAIKSNKTITHDGRGCAELSILSDIMVESLKKYGVKERKSLSTIFPKNIPKDMYPHLIRGILDGDGSISFYARPGRKSHTKAIRFCQGSESFLKDLMDVLYIECGASPLNVYKEKESLWSIAYRSNKSINQIINYLYSDATIFLKRKKEICDLIMDELSKNGNTEITV